MSQLNSAVTFGDICIALGVRDHRIRYVLNKRTDIKPLRVAGVARLYPQDVIEKIRDELTAIDSKKSAVLVA